MNRQTLRCTVQGPAGVLDCALDEPAQAQPAGLAVLCHPHPQHGGTMDNKVVQTLARGFVRLGWRALRFDFRGVRQSAGTWDDGRGEVDDARAVVEHFHQASSPLVLGGFSFGAYVAAQAAASLPEPHRPTRLVMVGPAVSRFDVPPVPADTLVVHGELDDVVPLQAVFDWARPRSLPVTVVPGGGHFFHGQLDLLMNILMGAWRPPHRP